jgi:acetyl esterase/lipase
MTIRTALQVGCHLPQVPLLPWPYGAIEFAAGLVPKPRGVKRSTVQLESTTAELIHAPGVTHNTGRAILYFHGGGFIACGTNTHAALITRLSRYSNAPVLSVNYRMIPNSLGAAIEDCLNAYVWLRRHYKPEQIVLAGDSAGGYLALAVATHLAGLETPAATVLLSPLLQLDPTGKQEHPNRHCDAMFHPVAFDALASLIQRANGGLPYEPLDDLTEDLPPTLIHVSGHEVLMHDARLAQERLTALGVPVEVVIWPGQIHVFQIAAAFVPEAKRSLRQIGEYVVAVTEETSLMRLTHRTPTVGCK